MTGPSRRTFNHALLLGGAGMLTSSACAHRAPSPPRGGQEGLTADLVDGRLRLTYQFTTARAEAMKQAWAPTTLVVAIDALTQTPVCRPLSTGKSLVWSEPTPLEEGMRWTATVQPQELLALGAASGLWFLHATVSQYRSGVLALRLTG